MSTSGLVATLVLVCKLSGSGTVVDAVSGLLGRIFLAVRRAFSRASSVQIFRKRIARLASSSGLGLKVPIIGDTFGVVSSGCGKFMSSVG